MFKIYNSTRYKNFNEIEQLLQWLANKLEITTGEVVLISSSKMLKKFSTEDIELKALTTPTAFKDKYSIYLDDYACSDLNLILCHEMVHLKQFLDGDLKLDLDKYEFTWKGLKYDKSIPYNSRPWEYLATKQQGKLLSEYVKFNKKTKCLFSLFKKK